MDARVLSSRFSPIPPQRNVLSSPIWAKNKILALSFFFLFFSLSLIGKNGNYLFSPLFPVNGPVMDVEK